MNQRLQGWQLALALIIPAIIIGAAGYLAYGALSEDDQDLATGDDDTELTATPTVDTSPTPTTDDLAEATQPPAPTALVVPTAESSPTPAVTAGPTSQPTAVPRPTATSAPRPTTPPGPNPTATPDTTVATIACAGTIPATIEVGDTFGPLTATTSPPEAAATLQFTWNLGNATTVTSPATGNISYESPGQYTISLAASSATTGETASATCGTVRVTESMASLEVSCSVATVLGTPVDEARAGTNMRVTTRWTPADIPLYLQYEFETTDALIIVNPASSPNSQDNSFSTNDGAFRIFWRYQETGETGRLTCAAYPGFDGDPSPTQVPTTAPTVVITPTPTASETATATSTPTPSATVEATATPTPTPAATVTPTPIPTT